MRPHNGSEGSHRLTARIEATVGMVRAATRLVRRARTWRTAARRVEDLLPAEQPRAGVVLSALLGVLLIANAALLFTALAPPRAQAPGDDAPIDRVQAVVAQPGAEAAAPPVSRVPQPSVPLPGAALDWVDRVVMRGAGGPCGTGPAALYRSEDGGQSWRFVATPAVTVLRIVVVDARSAWFVGADRSCRPRIYVTSDGAQSWQVRPTTDGYWYRLPDLGSRLVHVPTGLVYSPCSYTLQVLFVVARSGAVVCGDGAAHRTADGGVAWSPMALSGARSLDFPTPTTGFAAAVDAACAGVRISRTDDAGATWRPTGCVATDPAGAMAVSFATVDHGLLSVDGSTYASADAGRTWRRCGLQPRLTPEAEIVNTACG